MFLWIIYSTYVYALNIFTDIKESPDIWQWNPNPQLQGLRNPPMFLQRPFTGKSQDVRHILAKTFRQLYTRDTISPETVKNLSVSKGGDDEYHERYVEMLQKVTYHYYHITD